MSDGTGRWAWQRFRRCCARGGLCAGRCAFSIVAATQVEVALCSGPARASGTHHTSETMSREVRGQKTNTRYVRNILPQTEAADSLPVVVEVLTPAAAGPAIRPTSMTTLSRGRNCPGGNVLSRVNPSQGFASQRVYTDDCSLDGVAVSQRRRSFPGTSWLPSPLARLTATISTISMSWPDPSGNGRSATTPPMSGFC